MWQYILQVRCDTIHLGTLLSLISVQVTEKYVCSPEISDIWIFWTTSLSTKLSDTNVKSILFQSSNIFISSTTSLLHYQGPTFYPFLFNLFIDDTKCTDSVLWVCNNVSTISRYNFLTLFRQTPPPQTPFIYFRVSTFVFFTNILSQIFQINAKISFLFKFSSIPNETDKVQTINI